MLQRLLDLLFVFKEYVILTLCILFSLILLALNDNGQVKYVRSAATVVFGVVQEKLSFIPDYIGLRSENEVLRRVNIELADEAAQLREAKLENVRLRQMIGLKQEYNYPLVAAKVVGKNLTLLRNTLTLNTGSVEGVQQGMPVVSDGGLVGIVASVSDQYAVVNVLYNVDFRASAKIQRSRVDGILAWNGTSLILRNVTKTLDVLKGDVVITSEYSKSYPPDIRIGVVANVSDVEGSLFRDITIAPGVDFVKLEEVYVLQYLRDDERNVLEEKGVQHALK